MKTLVIFTITFLTATSSIWAQSEQFGNGAATARPMLKQAVEKFATFTPGSDLSPMWGQKVIEPILATCK